MTYQLFVDDNFRYMDSSERVEAGSYATLDAAVRAAKDIVDRYLRSAHKPGMAADELFRSYTSFGEDPWIASPEGRVPFSAWEYARQRCEELTS